MSKRLIGYLTSENYVPQVALIYKKNVFSFVQKLKIVLNSKIYIIDEIETRIKIR